MTHWLLAAECEVRLLQLLLDCKPADVDHSRHLLLSLGHVHASTAEFMGQAERRPFPLVCE